MWTFYVVGQKTQWRAILKGETPTLKGWYPDFIGESLVPPSGYQKYSFVEARIGLKLVGKMQAALQGAEEVQFVSN